MAAVPSIGRARADTLPPEAEATRALYESYANQIFGYCLHQLGSREEAEDAVQSTFLNAFRGLRRGVVPEQESAWLFKIAHNVCLSRRRSTWRRGRIESPADFEVVEELAPAPLRRADELIGLQDVLEAMPEAQRRAILLREWQGLSYREIAEELELSQAAVETLIFRARRSLAQGLEQPPAEQRSRRRRIRAGTNLGGVVTALKSMLAGGTAVKAAGVAAVVAVSSVAATQPLRGHPSQARPQHHAAVHTPAANAKSPVPLGHAGVDVASLSATLHVAAKLLARPGSATFAAAHPRAATLPAEPPGAQPSTGSEPQSAPAPVETSAPRSAHAGTHPAPSPPKPAPARARSTSAPKKAAPTSGGSAKAKKTHTTKSNDKAQETDKTKGTDKAKAAGKSSDDSGKSGVDTKTKKDGSPAATAPPTPVPSAVTPPAQSTPSLPTTGRTKEGAAASVQPSAPATTPAAPPAPSAGDTG